MLYMRNGLSANGAKRELHSASRHPEPLRGLRHGRGLAGPPQLVYRLDDLPLASPALELAKHPGERGVLYFRQEH